MWLLWHSICYAVSLNIKWHGKCSNLSLSLCVVLWNNLYMKKVKLNYFKERDFISITHTHTHTHTLWEVVSEKALSYPLLLIFMCCSPPVLGLRLITFKTTYQKIFFFLTLPSPHTCSLFWKLACCVLLYGEAPWENTVRETSSQ